MRKVRLGIFETNSSSMHSFTLEKIYTKKHTGFKNFRVSKNGTLTLALEYYARAPFRLLNTPNDKVKFLLADALEYVHREDLKVVNENLAQGKYSRDVKDIIDILHKYVNFKTLKIKKEPYMWQLGVERSTEYSITQSINKNGIDKEEFIFNPNYIVIVDGDEYRNDEIYYNGECITDNTRRFFSKGTLTQKGIEKVLTNNPLEKKNVYKK